MKKKKISKFKRWLIKKLGGVLPNKGVCYKVETQKAYLMSAVIEVPMDAEYGFSERMNGADVKRKLSKELARQIMKAVPEECVLRTEDMNRYIKRYRVDVQVVFPGMK